MKSVPIKLSFAEEVKTFVNVANRYDYDMDLRVGRHVVDAKSILGIFSLDLSKPITLEVYSDDCDDLLEELKAFIVCVVAGLGNVYGAVVAAILLGLIEAGTQYVFGVRWSFAILLLIVIVVLIWRPYGLFGQKQVVRL